MLIVGLTGGLSSGKSTVAGIFQKLGAAIIDADNIAHQVLKQDDQCRKDIIEYFGEDIVSSEGHIDRKILAERVFSSSEDRKKLESLMHPVIRQEMRKQIDAAQEAKTASMLILDIPLLFESEWHKEADVTIVVSASREQQIQRAERHLHISRQEIEQRLRAQMSLEEKVQQADYVVRNHETIHSTEQQVNHIYQELLERSHK